MSRSRIPNKKVGLLTTRSFLFDSDSGDQFDHFLHHTSKLGIPVEVMQFLLKLIETQISFCAPQFPLILQPNFIPFMLRSRSRKFWKGRSRGHSRKFWKLGVGISV